MGKSLSVTFLCLFLIFQRTDYVVSTDDGIIMNVRKWERETDQSSYGSSYYAKSHVKGPGLLAQIGSTGDNTVAFG
jgi:hypothetical protein